MKKYLRPVFLPVLAIWLCVCVTFASEMPSKAVDASAAPGDFYAVAAILYNKNTGETVFARNADARLPMASTTKIMTALVALENSPLDSIVTVPREAEGVEGSSAYLAAGDKMPLGDMLYALMLESANDSAVAIALHVAGSVEGFVALMNDKAASLGLTNTHFDNPHGLPSDNHYSSARDMAILFSAALDNGDFARITSTRSHKVSLDGQMRYFSNHNRLLKSLDGCIGGKTGYTKQAGRCLVSGSKRDNVCMICVTLNAGDDWNIHKNLTEYGFSLYESRKIASAGQFSFNAAVVGGTVDHARVSNRDELEVCVKKNSPPITHTVEMSRFYYAPVALDGEAGRIVFRQNGEVLGEVKLYFEQDVEIKAKKSFWQRLFGK